MLGVLQGRREAVRISKSSQHCLVILLLGQYSNRQIKSKHLKGQLDPPVGNGNVFWTKGGQLDPPVSDVTFFGPKAVGFHVFLR